MEITPNEPEEDFTLINLNQTSMPLAWGDNVITNAILKGEELDPETKKKHFGRLEPVERRPRKPIDTNVSVPRKVARYLADRKAEEGSAVASESAEVWLDSLNG